jgi:hypothetical protein
MPGLCRVLPARWSSAIMLLCTTSSPAEWLPPKAAQQRSMCVRNFACPMCTYQPHTTTHTHTRRPPPCNTFDLSRLGLRVSTFCVVCCCVRSRIRLADIFLKALALSPCLTFNQHSDSTHSQRTFLKSVLTCVQDRVKRSTDRHDAKRRQVWDRDLVRRRCALRGCQPRTSWHTRCAFFSLSFHFQFCLELFDFFEHFVQCAHSFVHLHAVSLACQHTAAS